MCVSASTGAVRVVSDGSWCRPNELPLQWNVAGEGKVDAQWKLDAFARHFQAAGGPLVESPCTAAASITVMQ